MKAQVTRRFRDAADPKHPVYEVGQDFEGDAERVAFLAKAGFVRVIAEETKPVRKAPQRRSTKKTS